MAYLWNIKNKKANSKQEEIVTINEIQNRHQRNLTPNQFFEKISKINKLPTRLTEKNMREYTDYQ